MSASLNKAPNLVSNVCASRESIESLDPSLSSDVKELFSESLESRCGFPEANSLDTVVSLVIDSLSDLTFDITFGSLYFSP
ncbi:unnamed protein product [[Candida] boidinii]|nr:unnamed protein product [[Candida] boidinii]